MDPSTLGDPVVREGRLDISRVACRRCNSKKVKCTATHGLPCHRCVLARSPCVLINSQRGKYPRRLLQAPKGRLQHSSTNEKPNEDIVQGEYRVEPNDWAARQSLRTGSPPLECRAPQDSNTMLYLHIADQTIHSSQQPIHDDVSTFYIGESFSLSYVVNDILAPFLSDKPKHSNRLYFPIDPDIDPSNHGGSNIVVAQAKLLREKGIFYAIKSGALEKLLDTYFSWFHPSFPLVTEEGFRQRCSRNEMSLLVLNAMLLVAATMCDISDLTLLGFRTRREAREIFYRQAKTLYDADTDPDKVNTIIAVFLMSFWWEGSNDQKDSWHWLGIAVSLAQSLGMHRSTAGSRMTHKQTRQWKRVWWCIQIRDSLTSGSIGRPQHFSCLDCDIELPQPEDLEVYDSISHKNEKVHDEKLNYFCQMAKLSIIFSDIITSRYAVRATHSFAKTSECEKSLEVFESQIPPVLQYHGLDGESGRGLWSAMLSMAYIFATILLCRPPCNSNGPRAQVWGNRKKATDAANEATRIMEDILSSSAVRLCHIHTIPALFNSLSMHVFSLCTSDSITRALAENRARICMLGLTYLQESWPVSGWILNLFVQVTQKVKDKISSSSSSSSWTSSLDSIDSGNFTGFEDMSSGSQHDIGATEYDTHGSMPLNGIRSVALEGDNFSNLFVLDNLMVDLDDGSINFLDLLTSSSTNGNMGVE